MRLWYNQIHDSRRSLLETEQEVVTIGRDRVNTLVLNSPLVSKRQALVRKVDGKLVLHNLGLNSCLVGEEEVLGGQSREINSGESIRIWPYTVTVETTEITPISRQDLEQHLRSLMSGLEEKVHQTLLGRFELYELEQNRLGDERNILQLEQHIEDVCREIHLFSEPNEPLLDEIVGLVLRDYVVNQLILESDDERTVTARLTWNEFDVPTTLVPERETELKSLLKIARERLELEAQPDLSSRIRRVETHFNDVFPQLRPQLHRELRRYLILRTLKKDLKDTVFGYGPLQDLLRAPTISEIMVVKSDQIYVERDGVVELSGRRFLSDKVTESIIERIVAQVGRRIDKSQPLVDARLDDGSRVNAVIPPLAVRGPCLTIRKFPAFRFTMDDLVDLGSVTPAVAAFLRACVVDKRNILVSGGTGAGKTTLLNVLSAFIPAKERIITVEDTQELQLRQDHVVSLESKPPNIEGAGAYTIRDLVRNALRMRPDRIIVGECRGAESLDMLQAMNTGHDGSMTTVHANSSEEVVKRLELLVLMGAELPVASIHRQIASALDVIVQINRETGGRRSVTQVSEVAGYDEHSSRLIVHDVFNRRDGQELRPTGYLPTFLETLLASELLPLEFLLEGKASS
jgi:Flp pilus assembly CpaF family ATPase